MRDCKIRPFFISVYAIARNEEHFAERWYNCFKEADEVCVLVNNTTDKTASILRSLGAKVRVKNYKDFRFDAALNDAMKLCSKKATLLFKTDMDDVIEPGWRQKIEHAWEIGLATGKEPNAIVYTYEVIYGERPNQKQPMARYSIHTPDGWFWQNRVHEVLEHQHHKNFLYYPKFVMKSRPEKKDHSRYLGLMEKDAAEGGRKDGGTLHILGREYLLYKRYDDAIEMFNKHLEHPGAVWKCERAASMKFMADCYSFKGDTARQEVWLWKAMCEDENDRDAPYVLGQLLLLKKEYSTAIKVFERCLSIKKPQLDFPIFNLEAWGEHPWMCLGECYFHKGKWQYAKQALDEALKINPQNELAKTMASQIDYAIKHKTPPQAPALIPILRIEVPELKD